MTPPRVFLVHDHPVVIESLRRVCHRHQTALVLLSSQSELLETLSAGTSSAELAITKEVGEDWFTVAGVLLACRVFGVTTPFLVISDPSDAWTERAVETAGSAALIDERSSRWLLPLLVDDWLASLACASGKTPFAKSQETKQERISVYE